MRVFLSEVLKISLLGKTKGTCIFSYPFLATPCKKVNRSFCFLPCLPLKSGTWKSLSGQRISIETSFLSGFFFT